MDRSLLAAYDRSAEGYDARFRELLRAKFRAARGRTPFAVAADLARLPLRRARPICAFTSVLDRVPAALAGMGRALEPGGQLAVSFLAGEAPSGGAVARGAGLRLLAGPIPARQDRLFTLRKDVP